MRHVKDDRTFGTYILFSILTCGIYSIFFFYGLVNDLNTACEPMERQDENWKSPNYILLVIFSLLTCGIYALYWLYKQGNRIQIIGKRYGIDISENGTTLLMWPLLTALLCGVGTIIGTFITYYYLITNANKLCKAYNQTFDSDYDTYHFNSNNSNSYIESADVKPDDMSYKASGDSWYGDNPYDDIDYSNVYSRGTQNSDFSYNNNNFSKVKDDAFYDNSNSYDFENNSSPSNFHSSDDVTQMISADTNWKPSGSLNFIKGERKGTTIPIHSDESIVIGRDSSKSDVILSNKDISREHCEVTYDAAHHCYFICDHSSYGTYRNGHRIQKDVFTHCDVGDTISLSNGDNVFVLK